jgi:hypothetical protein
VESSEDEQVISLVRASASTPEPAGPTALACRIPQTAPPMGSGPLALWLAPPVLLLVLHCTHRLAPSSTAWRSMSNGWCRPRRTWTATAGLRVHHDGIQQDIDAECMELSHER